MEKELPPPESMASVQIKPDYAPSEIYSTSEPPPAYRRPKSVSVQVAKIIAVTIVLVSVVLGGCILASAYITANASCRHLEQELQLLSETMDRYPPLQPEALVQEEPQQKENLEPLETQESKAAKEVRENALPTETSDSQDSSSEESSESNTSEDSDDEERMPVHIKLPIQIDFDDIAGAMMEKNQRSKMNCIVEKKRAEEVIDHQAKTVNLPFGLNLTTDPRYERVSGERIAIFCESGNVQRQPEPQDQEETIMIQPIMIPLPPPQFHTHMPMQAAPQMQQQYHHPMEQMRPPMPNPMMQMQQASQNQLPPSGILHQIAQQIIAQKLQQEAERSQEEVQENELRQDSEERSAPNRVEIQQTLSRIPIPEEVLTQINRLPNRDVIVAVSQQAPEEAPQMRVIQHQRQTAQEINGRQSYVRGMPVTIPIVMQQEQEEDTSATEGERMHIVHPRSIRSVEELIPKAVKRVKRCNCDCAC